MKRRLSPQDVVEACDPNEYGDKSKYPYINYSSDLLSIITSEAAEEYDKYMYNNKCSAPSSPRTIYKLREIMKNGGFEAKNNINYPDCTSISSHRILINHYMVKELKYYKISYLNQDINSSSGIVIFIHGGGFCTKSPLRNFSFAELISRQTKCICFILNYKLSPEYHVSYSINEVIQFYKYISFSYPNISIGMTGDSCGGGMILRALQIIRNQNQYKSLSLPSCIWLNSAWTQLNIGIKCKSHNKNKDIDAIVRYDLLKRYADCAVGNIDADLNTLRTNSSDLDYYSPINGDFNDFCPMYYMVGATECLLDDTLLCAKKAYNLGVDVTVDIEPYMLHVYAIRVNLFNEAKYATIKGCKWMMKYMKKQQTLNSKL